MGKQPRASFVQPLSLATANKSKVSLRTVMNECVLENRTTGHGMKPACDSRAWEVERSGLRIKVILSYTVGLGPA